MRTEAEISMAVKQMRDAVKGGMIEAPASGEVKAIIAMLQVLRWVQGDDSSGGFGDALAELIAVDDAAKKAQVNRHADPS